MMEHKKNPIIIPSLKRLKYFCCQCFRHGVFVIGTYLFLQTNAFASGDVSSLTTALQGLVDILTGKTAKLIAILAIAGTGYLWISGKLSLRHAAVVGLGIGVIFGASEIATLLGA